MPHQKNGGRKSSGGERALLEIAQACDSQCAPGELLEVMSHALIPAVADAIAVDLVDDDGSIVRIVTRHIDDAKQEALIKHRDSDPLPLTSSYGYPRVIKTGKPQFIPGVSERLADRLFPGAQKKLDGMLIRSYICVPIVTNGRTLGALTVITTDPKHALTGDDLASLEAIADKIAEALDKHTDGMKLNAFRAD